MKTNFIYVLLISLSLMACSDLIEYSPFEANVDNSSINTENVKTLKEHEHDTVRFAVISDTHSFYKDMEDAVSSINQQHNLNFVICCGDITESGLAWEFKQYRKFTDRLSVPVFTVIGNHDYLSNGAEIYKQMFGPLNFSFTYCQYKFILFDDIVWESGNRAPDFAWLREQVTGNNAEHCILISHIPSASEEMKTFYTPEYGEIIANYNIILSLHGHNHSFEQSIVSGKPSITNGSIENRTYNIVCVYNTQFSLKQISF